MEGRTVPCCKKLFGAPQKGAVKNDFSFFTAPLDRCRKRDLNSHGIATIRT